MFIQNSLQGQTGGPMTAVLALWDHLELTRANQKSLVLTCARPPETRATHSTDKEGQMAIPRRGRLSNWHLRPANTLHNDKHQTGQIWVIDEMKKDVSVIGNIYLYFRQ
ncbi:hypothetical protein Pcinc_041712 [Petrolisthes cinctipes]|uniref:Uncharacterized protein n=1 Tax=Petrolisthes cinctipes TaxID=88211 RepID=A0AAE1BJ23_PETCI|nr:hypothetical protein Pcinc_041712 [Petrolisthes cinctipes]